MNIWLPDGPHPIKAATLTDTAEFQDFSWGHGYEHEMPLGIPAKEVADAVLATLPAQENQSVLVS
ncbi:hypothetical protein [Streptomyces sp. NPDC001404]|uniref:hypothetical protein n=1 Tax=Streptomyces sp. NPDC001404 TaxID=3364571 RepID=UPI0036CC8707